MKTNIRKNGISLIMLVITIIVIIILAGAIILSLSSSNPIKSAKKARFNLDVDSFRSQLTVWLSSEFINTDGKLDGKAVDATKNSGQYNNLKMQDIITIMNDTYADKFEIRDGVLVYIGTDEDEKEWSNTGDVDIYAETQTEVDIYAQPEVDVYGDPVVDIYGNPVMQGAGIWSDAIIGDLVHVNFTSDYSVTSSGFRISRITYVINGETKTEKLTNPIKLLDYPINQNLDYVIYKKGATSIKVNFSLLMTESGYDFIYLMNRNFDTIQSFNGNVYQ